MSDAPTRIAVVGAGIMGANHARVSRNLKDASLVAIVDADAERAKAAAGTPGVDAFTDPRQLEGLVDVAVVAVPTSYHLDVAATLAGFGVHVLVEKPLAPSLADARSIIDACASAGVQLAVGHVERFNAAVRELPRFLEDPIHIDAARVSPFTARVPDGVIFDLMIHDLDIILSLAGPDAVPVSVSGVARAVRGSTEDLATATVAFSTGLTASFTTSRLGQEKRRRIEVTQDDTVINADLVRQDLTLLRMTRHEYLDADGPRYHQASVVEIPFIQSRGEPLALELQHFVDAVRTGGPVAVSGEDAYRALELASLIDAAVARS